ncbi:MAG TPA: PQQ-binding-like beta-propeller repeat protein [Bacteroidales bacterium]|nr:PQQ-binding-like beta-propeller repeat protein [Bacteroidales bacterium]
MKFTSSFILVLLFLSEINCLSQDNWTHFRGSRLDGISSTSKVPADWNNSIRWKTEIHGKGHSSPVVFGNQVWITTGTPDGRELFAVCADYETGKIIYDIKVFTPEKVPGKHEINTYSSPTPAIEKGFVYVHFGSSGTACIRTVDGTIVWKRDDYKCKHVQGPGSSPMIYKNLLILHFEGTDVRYIVALDKATGKEIWRADRPDEPYMAMTEIGKKAYITPYIINVKGRDQMVSVGSAVCIAYDPLTGKEIWRVVRGAESTVAMPVYEKGMLYYYCGYLVDDQDPKFTEILAVNPDGKGDITSTNVLWKKRDPQSTNQISSLLIKDGLIYTVTTRNIMMCIDAKTGDEVWTERQKANFNASPVFAGGNIWFCSIRGEVIAVKPGRKYEVAVHNQMDSGIWGTPAFLRNSVILRTEKYLCRISD